MKKLLAVAALALAFCAPARASTYAVTTDASSTTLKLNGRLHMQNLSGVEQLIVDSVKGIFTWTYGIQASTANFTGTGNTTYSVVTSSGIQVNGGGGVVASWVQATSNFFGNLVGNVTGNVTGNATTATTATNLASGGAGSMPYQTGAGATSFVSSVANSVLSIVGTTPTWLSYLPTQVSISTQNVSPGFNGASNFLQVGSDGKLPTIDGSKLTGISGTLSGGQNGFGAYWTGSTTLGVGPESITASSVTLPSSSKLLVAGGLDFEVTTVTGTIARVQYSSGTSGNFWSAVFQASTTYNWMFDVTLTSGTSTTGNPIITCTVNSDATAAHYGSVYTTYPNTYSFNNQGASAYWGFLTCGGGSINATDFLHVSLNLVSPITQSNRLAANGSADYTCQTQGFPQGGVSPGELYKGSPPWTVTCSVLNGFGATWESYVYQVGR